VCYWQNAGRGIVAFLAPATAPGDERSCGEAGDQADDAEGQDPARVGVAWIADIPQREEERADAPERRRDAEPTVEGFHSLRWLLLLHLRQPPCPVGRLGGHAGGNVGKQEDQAR
jgi:hypothetical protein